MIVTGQSSSITFEEDDNNEDVRCQRVSSRLPITSSPVSAVQRWRIDLENYTNPSSVPPSKLRMTSKTFNNKYAKISSRRTTNNNIINWPVVNFSDDNTEDPPSDDESMTYPKSLQLMPLYDIRDQILRGNAEVKDLKINYRAVKSKYGEKLKYLSLNNVKNCQYRRHVLNDVKMFPANYALVYGAVPYALCEYITYALITYCTDQNNLLYDGELELRAYCYMQLASQDLINWRDDINRAPLKRILEYACSFIGDKDLKDRISAYANFKDKKYISGQCVLRIKKSYNVIISSITADNTEFGTKVWNFFMDRCNVHHFICPHTEIEIAKGVKFIASKWEHKVADFKLQNDELDTMNIKFTISDIKTLFRFVPHIDRSTKKSLTHLRHVTCNMYTHLSKMFASHIVEYGICSATSIITTGHVDGFAKRYRDIISINNCKASIPILESKIASIKKVICSEINEHIPLPLGHIKFDLTAIAALMNVVNLIIIKCAEPIICLSTPELRAHDRPVAELISVEIQNLLDTTTFTSIRDINAWTKGDDNDVIYDAEGNLIFDDSFSSDSSSSSDDDDGDDDATADNIQNELNNLKRDD